MPLNTRYIAHTRRRLLSRVLFSSVCLIAFTFIGLVKTAMAQGGPPLLTDDPGTPGNKHWEINIATTFERSRDELEQELPLLDINYGVGNRIQLKFEIPYLRLKEDGERAKTAIGNPLVGVKWRFFENERKGLAISTYPQLEFNNPNSAADKGLDEEGLQIILPVEISHKLSLFEVNEEFGYRVAQKRMDEWFGGLALGRQVTNSLELLGEIYGTASRNFKESELLFNLGARYRINRNFTLLFSSGRSLRRAASNEPTLLIYAGTQFNF